MVGGGVAVGRSVADGCGVEVKITTVLVGRGVAVDGTAVAVGGRGVLVDGLLGT